MPMYQCSTPEGLLDDEKRAKLAGEITRIHCEMTGASPIFVHVSFAEARRGTSFSGGEISRVSFIRGVWRAGRPKELKQAFLRRVAQMWAEENRMDIKDVLVGLSESPAGNIMEFGEILPDPSAEKEWLERNGLAGKSAADVHAAA